MKNSQIVTTFKFNTEYENNLICVERCMKWTLKCRICHWWIQIAQICIIYRCTL